ncbi:MAG: Uma2 family endonuclease [Armatimonadetes bacterium]|nr:Uma2 family endonuclease [Armatimonadota bacterium]MDW8027076.1 Uma2 family endonuclease [Armatimonadota bacterium]
MSVEVGVRREVTYPESDGKPMADNTLQARYIVYIYDALEGLFRDEPDVFVAADLLWYPVEGEPNIRVAPDVMVVFGRPKGDRRSYLQWREDNIPPQVVFEVWSLSNILKDFVEKLNFYERYGVEEFYLYDPDAGRFEGWIRHGDKLVAIDDTQGWISPRLGIKFVLEGKDLVLHTQTSERIPSYSELRQQFIELRKEVEAERQRAEQEKQRAERERQRAERLAQRLRELGIEPEE